jgi:PHP domain
LLDGLSRVGGMTALALTDHGSMYGVIPFYAAAKKAGIKPIIGIEAYISPRGMTQKEGEVDADYHDLILLPSIPSAGENAAVMGKEELTRRVVALVEGLRPRLDASAFAWILENAGQTEWELALADVHLAAASGRLVLTDAEADELFALERHVDRRMLKDLLRA